MWTNPRELEFECCRTARTIYIGEGRAWCIVLGRYKMLVPTRDMSLVPHLMFGGYWESWVSVMLARMVGPGDVCLDGGANLGYFSLLMAMRAGESGKVVAVEANRKLVPFLEKTFEVNGLDVEVWNKALWDKSAETHELNLYGDLLGGTSVREERWRREGQKVTETVETLTIDDMELERLDVVKLDVEGSEPRALDGMRQTVKRNPQMKLLVEYAPGGGVGPELYDQMVEMGFKVMLLRTDAQVEPVKKESLPVDGVHMLYLHQ